MSLKPIEYPARKDSRCGPAKPYVIHVWGPGIYHRKSVEGSYFPTAILRTKPHDPHFALFEKIDIHGSSKLVFDPTDGTTRIHTTGPLTAYYDERCRFYGGSVFDDSVDKETVIAHALGQTSQALPGKSGC